jgi:hypothetical protein
MRWVNDSWVYLGVHSRIRLAAGALLLRRSGVSGRRRVTHTHVSARHDHLLTVDGGR